jgi:hypothetical protein
MKQSRYSLGGVSMKAIGSAVFVLALAVGNGVEGVKIDAEKELNESGSQGFRFVPQTAFEKSGEDMIIMERGATSNMAYEYRLLATHRTSTLAKELNEAARQGFSLGGSFNRDEKDGGPGTFLHPSAALPINNT